MAPGKLLGKVAVVTGGGSGIGRAICQLFAKEGANVAILDINRTGMGETIDSLTYEHGNNHCAIECDVTDMKNVKNAFEFFEKRLGKKCTILVNAAAIRTPGIMGNLNDEDISSVIDVNLKGTIVMANEFVKRVPSTTEEVRGVIVNISSVSGRAAVAKESVYSASKFGIIGVTKSVSAEFKRHRVRCNVVLPGYIKSSLESKSLSDNNSTDKKVLTHPFGRAGTPEEVAKACLYLASEDSTFVCGACLDVTGGADGSVFLRSNM